MQFHFMEKSSVEILQNFNAEKMVFCKRETLTSPSGVSEGHSMPHWEGWRERGPLTFLVFSNWEEILVIMPKAEM